MGDERVPAGQSVQVKVSLTDPQPISSGRGSLAFDTQVFSFFEGIALYSATGDVAGAAVVRGSQLTAQILSPLGTFGTLPDYPLLTIVFRALPTAPAGYTTQVTLDPSSLFLNAAGQTYAAIYKPGTLTIGGTLSVGNVVPGAGLVPAGGTVRILGSGFAAGTQVQVNEVSLSATRFISSTELELTLAQAAEMGGRRIRVRNPDNTQVTYYSYLRSQPMGSTSRSLLSSTVPLYSSSPLAAGTLRLTGSGGRFDALALENQTSSAVSVSMELASAAGAAVARNSIQLPAGFQYIREASEIFGGFTPPSGGSIRVSAGAAIRMLGLSGDDGAGTVSAVLLTPGTATPAAQLSAVPSSLTFASAIGGVPAPAQTIHVTSTGAALSFTASSAPAWLSVNPASGLAPGAITASVNTTGLAVGTYQGTITLAPPAPAAALTIPVQLTVTGSQPQGQISALPAALNFTHTVGAALPAAQTINVLSPLGAVNFAATATPAWLSVDPAGGTTPAVVSARVNPVGLAPGTHQGTIVLAPPPPATPATVVVQLTVTASTSSAQLTASPGSLGFAYSVGGPGPAAQTVSVASTGSPLKFTAGASVPWLTLDAAGASTPATLTVRANPAGLNPGTYHGVLTLTPPAPASAAIVAVQLTVLASGAGAQLTASPFALRFAHVAGGPAPASQAIHVASTGAAMSFTAAVSAPASWLSVDPGGVTPGAVFARVNPAGLVAGTYQGTITLTPPAPASPLTVPVTLLVSDIPPPRLAASPVSLDFTHTLGREPPAGQLLNVLSTGAGLNFTASSTAAWIVADPAGGATPAALTVRVNPAGLGPGVHQAMLTLASPASSLGVPVRLTVSPPGLALRSIVSAATQIPGSVAPGEFVTLYGDFPGVTEAQLRLTSAGLMDTTLDGVRVLFDGVAAPLVYVSASQINAIVPYETANNGSAGVEVEVSGARTPAAAVAVAATSPGIFTAGSSGRGQAAALNPDLTPNDPAHPAERGSAVALYGTGEGVTVPPSLTGSITEPDALKTPAAPVTATVGGLPATVLYAGSAPGLAAGVLQVNVAIPAEVAPGAAVPVTIRIGGAASQAGVTLAVQ